MELVSALSTALAKFSPWLALGISRAVAGARVGSAVLLPLLLRKHERSSAAAAARASAAVVAADAKTWKSTSTFEVARAVTIVSS